MISFIIANWAEIALAVTTIVRLTPTKKDDEIESKVGKAIHFIFEATRKK